MERESLIRLFEEIVEADAGAITGNETLRDLTGWSSLAAIEFIAMADEKFGIALQARRLSECATVNDLMGLLHGNGT
jgi:acyl carrier protein